MDDAIYDDYKKRRDQEWRGFHAAREQEATTKRAAESAKSTSRRSNRDPSAYKLDTDNAYHHEGYRQNQSQLGEDPITTIRTMRNNLRRQAIIDRESGLVVKERLCQEGIRALSEKENQLITLSKQRTDALMIGDMGKAEGIRSRMFQIKDDAVRKNYMDLITDENQVRAYGIESKWTKERNDVEPKPVMMMRGPFPVRRAPSPVTRQQSAPQERAASAERKDSAKIREPSTRPNGRFVPDNLPVRERRARSAARSPEGNFAPPMERRRSSPPPRANSALMQRAPARRPPSVEKRNDYDVKKNERLRDFQQRPPSHVVVQQREMLVDDPYKLPTYYGKCPYCDEIDENFAKQFKLENHYAEHCKMMNSCRYCHKVVLISQLTDHYVARCDFLRDKKVRCKKCGLATEREDDDADVDHPLCRGRQPPSGAKWCPLCAVAVNDNKEDWIKHTTSDRGCYNNPRNSKIPHDAKTSLVPDQLFLTTRPKSTVPGSTPGAGPGSGPYGDPGSQTYKVPDAVYHGPQHDMRGKRLIDADQLLVALKAANAKKKAQRKKKEDAERAASARAETTRVE